MKLIKPLYPDLMIKYLLLVAGAVAGFFGAYIHLNGQSSKLLADYAAEIIRQGNKSITFSAESMELDLEGGKSPAYRYEILEGYTVIYSVGPEIGNETAYTPEEINSMIQRHYELMDDVSYIPEYFPFTGTDGNPYVLIIKKPKDSSEVQPKAGVLLPEYLRGTQLEMDVSRLIRKSIIAVALVLAAVAVLFSLLTTTTIMRPLKQLRAGFRQVDMGRLDTRLNFSGNREFEEVRDAFNKMIERLEESEAENRQLQESRKQFILDLSHDLKTPITTIQGYSEAILTGMVEDEEVQKKYISYIYRKSQIITGLITKLFDYSKLESVHNRLEQKEQDLANCFREAIIQNLDGLETKEFRVDIDIPEEPVLFLFDKTEMERGIGNIIANQLKYNPERTSVFYRLKVSSEKVFLILEDRGIGIEEEVLARIFNLMVRGDSSRHGVDGTGLGLAITKKVVELHGGKINVRSTIGKGTVFEITFPR